MSTYIFLVKHDDDLIEELFYGMWPIGFDYLEFFNEISKSIKEPDQFDEIINEKIKESVTNYKSFLNADEYCRYMIARYNIYKQDKIYYFVYYVKKHKWVQV